MQLGLGPAVLHAAALRGLQVVDPDSASIFAVQLMSFYLVPQPPTASRQMTVTPSGEPLVSALRVLFALGQDVSLFQWAVLETLPGPAKGEALRLLVNLSPETTSWLIERFAFDESDLIAAGALDLALARPEVAGSQDAVRGVLGGQNVDLVGYVAMSISALRNPAWLALLYEVAATETKDRSRVTTFLEALRAVPGDARAGVLARELDARLATLRAHPVEPAETNPDDDEDFVY